MALAVFLSIMAGAFGVFQAGMNKQVADHLGFTASLLFNGFFFLLFNLAFFILVLAQPKLLPQEFAVQWAFHQFRWWWLVPGFLGFALVMGLAVAIGRIGAIQTFVISIAAQVLASTLWDYWTGDGEITSWRIVGAAVTIVGAVVATLS